MKTHKEKNEGNIWEKRTTTKTDWQQEEIDPKIWAKEERIKKETGTGSNNTNKTGHSKIKKILPNR